MKRAFAWMMAAFCAAAMCVSLVACGEGENAGDVDAESIVGHEVTEAQWDAAFDELLSAESVYTVRGKVTSEVLRKEGEYAALLIVEYSGYVEKTPAAEHILGKEELVDYSGDIKEVVGEEAYEDIIAQKEAWTLMTVESYLERTEDTCYLFWLDSRTKQWSRESVDSDVMLLEYYFSSLYKDCKGHFDSFHYDVETNGYMLASAETGEEYENTVIKFNEEGKLIAIFGGEGEHGFRDRKIVFHFVVEYTAEEIVFPTDYIEN